MIVNDMKGVRCTFALNVGRYPIFAAYVGPAAMLKRVWGFYSMKTGFRIGTENCAPLHHCGYEREVDVLHIDGRQRTRTAYMKVWPLWANIEHIRKDNPFYFLVDNRHGEDAFDRFYAIYSRIWSRYPSTREMGRFIFEEAKTKYLITPLTPVRAFRKEPRPDEVMFEDGRFEGYFVKAEPRWKWEEITMEAAKKIAAGGI